MGRYIKENKPPIYKQKSKKYFKNMDIPLRGITNVATQEKQPMSVTKKRKSKRRKVADNMDTMTDDMFDDDTCDAYNADASTKEDLMETIMTTWNKKIVIGYCGGTEETECSL